MGLYQVAAITGFSIVFAAVIGLVSIKNSLTAYRPFIYLVWLACINHPLSLILVYYLRSNTANANIYVLFESLLFIWLFRNWGLFKKNQKIAPILFILILSIWLVDNIVLHELKTTNVSFRIASSFILIFLAIEQLIVLITTSKKNLLYNSSFIICCGILIYFSYKAFIEVFFLMEINSSIKFISNIYTIFVFINLFVNLIFAWAVLWIPKKQKSTLLL
jgi:hypothetical protein